MDGMFHRRDLEEGSMELKKIKIKSFEKRREKKDINVSSIVIIIVHLNSEGEVANWQL